ncbi:MAG: DUF151 domain-containing protein [Treponema sp.]|nr:DUF151 domain-containing protein [Treponema sp.]
MQKMLHAEIWTVVQTGEGNAVLLRTLQKNIAVPIFIGQLEAQSMLAGMEDRRLPRPLTHDLLLNLLESQDLVLDRVEIHGLKENVFYARLVIDGDRRAPLHLDCRPSDALCLAARRKCPVLISGEVISLAGIPVDFFIEALQDGDFSGGGKHPLEERHRQRLVEQLADAVEKEEYEQAAKIRDVIKAMDGD